MGKKLALILSFILIFNLFDPLKAEASSFTTSYVRLTNQSANSSLSGTVCAEPSSPGAGTENKISVTFPSDFTVSSSASNWTTTVTNLPSGSTPWPGIGSAATSVSGQSVTFASSDLTSSVLYCFNFTGASSTTGSSGNDKAGTLTTKNSSNTTIDSTTYSTSILSSNQISVTASVDPSVSNLPVAIESTTAGSNFPQNTTLSYKITYGNNASTSIPLKIQAEWSKGTIEGSPSPSVDLLDYVLGSASNAYGSTSPVIDTVNRTITWTISSFPASTTGQTVTFSLKTNDSYQGSSLVDFTISARAISGSTVTPDQTVTQKYLYVSASPTATPTPTPTSAPSSTTPTPTPTATPTPAPAPLSFSDISIKSISQSGGQILIQTNNNAILNFLYGENSSSFPNSIKTLTYQKQNEINVSSLKPNTNYYFKVTATDENGKTITSDIFTFQTAAISAIPSVNLQSVLTTSGDNVLLSPQASNPTQPNAPNIIVLPTQTILTIEFSLEKDIPLKEIQAILRNKNVLGASTIEVSDASSNYINLVETKPGVYTGKILSPAAGQYDVFVKLTDFSGNILEQKIADLNVTTKFRVFKKGATNQPVENTRVLLYLYNSETKIYNVISPNVLSIQNPSFSLPDGTVDIVLPIGKYKAEISNIGYDSQIIYFSIDPYTGGYPTVYLQEKPFNILNTIKYYFYTFSDGVNASEIYIKAHADSSRLFDFITMSSLLVFILITLYAFSARTHVSLFYIPYFFIYRLRIIFKKTNPLLIFGKVEEKDTLLPISKATISLTDVKTGKVIAMLKTNRLGEFYYETLRKDPYKISVIKNGFSSLSSFQPKNQYEDQALILKIDKLGGAENNLIETIIIFLEDLLSSFLEFLLFLGVIIEFYFIFTFGFLRIAPFLTMSTLTIIMVLIFIYKPRNIEEKT